MATETELERLIVRLTGDSKNYEKMLDNAVAETQTYVDKAGRLHDKATGRFLDGQKRMQSSMERTARGMMKLGKSAAALGRSLSFRLTAPIVALGGASVKAYGNFNQAMTESLSIMQTTERQAREMSDLALGLAFSGQVIQSPRDLGRSYFYLASAGKNAEQSMALLPSVAKFATAGAFDMALATDLLTDAQSALGMTSKDAAKDQENLAKVSDILVGANTLANASVQQFSTALTSKAGAAFKAYNIDLNEGVALLAAYADQGIKAELAGNAADRMLRLLTKATRDNADEFERLNIRVFDAKGEFRSFKDIIGDLERATASMSTEQKTAALEALGFEARVQAVILPLLGTSEALGTYAEKLERMGGMTDEVANKQLKSFNNQMKITWNQIKVVAIDIGNLLVPMVQKAAEIIRGFVGLWKGWSTGAKYAAVAVASLLAAIGPLLIGAGSLTFFAGQTMLLIQKLAAFNQMLTLSKLGVIGFGSALTGLVAIGFVAFLGAARLELERLIAKLDEARKKTRQFEDSRATSIQKMMDQAKDETDPVKRAALERDITEAIKQETERRLNAQKNAAKALDKENKKYTAHFMALGKDKLLTPTAAYKQIGAMFGHDTRTGLNKEYEDAKASQKKWADWLAQSGWKPVSKQIPEVTKQVESLALQIQTYEELAAQGVRVNRNELARLKAEYKETTDALGKLWSSNKYVQGAYSGAKGAGGLAKNYLAGLGQMSKGIWQKGKQGATLFYGAWSTTQEVKAKEWRKREEEVRKLVDRNLTPREKYKKAMEDLEQYRPRLGEEFYQREAKRLAEEMNNEIESLHPTLHVATQIDVPKAGSREMLLLAQEMRFAQEVAQTGRRVSPIVKQAPQAPKPMAGIPTAPKKEPMPMHFFPSDGLPGGPQGKEGRQELKDIATNTGLMAEWLEQLAQKPSVELETSDMS